MKKKNLVIRIEIKKRDLEARFLLSLLAALKGYRVFIGNASQIEWAIKKKLIKRSIIIENSIAKAKTSFLDFLKNNSHEIFSIDEEGGLVFEDYSNFLKLRSSKLNISKVKKVFCWGKFDFISWKKKYKNYSSKFVITGSPRIDLWSKKISLCYGNEIKKIKKRFGNYILVTTNFVYGNSLIDIRKQIKTKRIRDYIKTEKDIKNEMNFFREDKLMHEKFIELLLYLDENLKGYKIVLRPHPVENVDKYKSSLKNKKNIIIDNSGYIVPWIKGSSAVIQNGCQTGLEAFGLKKPVITYAPFNRGKNLPKGVRKNIPTLISKKINNKKLLTKFLNSGSHKKIKKFNNKLFKIRFKMSENLASNNILNEIKKINIDKTDFDLKKTDLAIKNLKTFLRKGINYFSQSRLHQKKNEPIRSKDLVDKKNNFSKYNKKFNKIKIKKLFEGFFYLYQ